MWQGCALTVCPVAHCILLLPPPPTLILLTQVANQIPGFASLYLLTDSAITNKITKCDYHDCLEKVYHTKQKNSKFGEV